MAVSASQFAPSANCLFIHPKLHAHTTYWGMLSNHIFSFQYSGADKQLYMVPGPAQSMPISTWITYAEGHTERGGKVIIRIKVKWIPQVTIMLIHLWLPVLPRSWNPLIYLFMHLINDIHHKWLTFQMKGETRGQLMHSQAINRHKHNAP